VANLAFGVATSQSPQLYTRPEDWWRYVRMDEQRTDILAEDGRLIDYPTLLAEAGASFEQEVTPEKRRARHVACQAALARLAKEFAAARVDVVVLIAQDRGELLPAPMPPLAVYSGSNVRMLARKEDQPPGEWPYGAEETNLPVAVELSKEIFDRLRDGSYDPQSSQGHGAEIGHTWCYAFRRIIGASPISIVPLHINADHPPGTPSVHCCLDIGHVLRAAVEGWRSNARVAVCASGGLSHIRIDEALDRSMLDAMQRGDEERLAATPDAKLRSGNGQARPWLIAAAAAAPLRMRLLDYVPCYRSPAGTGSGMAFAVWS
jgi:hypothetical protein